MKFTGLISSHFSPVFSESLLWSIFRSLKRITLLTKEKKMEDQCKVCCKRVKDTYWSRFQVFQFFQFVTGFCHQILNIPQKVARNFKKKLGETVSLRSPRGNTWDVSLMTDGDSLFFRSGWQKFVKDNFLKKNDLLTFKYNGASQFDVLMFDGETSCVKESSCFISRCEQGVDTRRKRKQKTPEAATNECSTDVVNFTVFKKPRTKYALIPSVGQPDPGNGDMHKAPESSSKPSSAHTLVYPSNRRSVTEEEKEMALRMAQEAASEYSFVKVMRASHVDNAFYLTVPSKWARSHLHAESQHIQLKFEERTWDAILFKTKNGGALSRSDWRIFVTDNSLEEYDACAFNLVSETTNAIVMDVKIFRAVDANPSSQVTPVSSKGKKPMEQTGKGKKQKE
ncbi:hypothetical protein ACH5RR_035072 [Cinchona calisaya]|uniref:TF-B3 domain-containing protein n=1 Tax=Cinchona calisaya TaxID=153742 RepID=A0ABD2YE43_9GENT